MKQLTKLRSWLPLKELAKHELHEQSQKDPSSFHLKTNNLSLDYSRQCVNQEILELLIELANEQNIKERIEAMFRGEKINRSENRAALHTVLRSTNSKPVYVDGLDIMPEILAAREQMWLISSKIRAHDWLGYDGRPIKNIINIGMGGSDFGPRFCIHALSAYRMEQLNYRFISDIDPHSFDEAIQDLEPATTLFIVSSKSFTTQETLHNAQKAMDWIGNPKHQHKHFIAVTSNAPKARAFGIDNVIPLWDWVGGRYSLCSAISLITCIAIGYERFLELLAGANSMDRHFQHSPLKENIPCIMALMGIWNINFLNIPSHLLLVYSKQLELLVPYIQQLDMESNGKSIDLDKNPIEYATGPIVWGGAGNQAQHSYYQLLCQGSHKVAADFISTQSFEHELINSFCHAKISVLSQGIKAENPHEFIKGGLPINHLNLHSYTPFSLGELISLYEHKIFAQSVIWHINPFDQPGVESAKKSTVHS